jgi:hypothetical protein
MGFSTYEKREMMRLKGVGPMIVMRLEQIGFCSLSQLAREDAADIMKNIEQKLGLESWHRSPRAHYSIQSIIDLAKNGSSYQPKILPISRLNARNVHNAFSEKSRIP